MTTTNSIYSVSDYPFEVSFTKHFVEGEILEGLTYNSVVPFPTMDSALSYHRSLLDAAETGLVISGVLNSSKYTVSNVKFGNRS